MSFTAKDVMSLREKTGLGMMDCKKALTETSGDPVAAEEWLRETKKGKMDTRTERATGEAVLALATMFTMTANVLAYFSLKATLKKAP